MSNESFGTKGNSVREYRSYINVGADKTAIRVNDATVSTNKLAVTGESVTLSGTTGVVALDKAPVYNVDGAKIGALSDSSFVWSTASYLSTEVLYRQDMTDTEQLAVLGTGAYAIDYDLGRVRYKKIAGTSDTCNYTSRQMNVDITGVEDIEIGAVEIKDSSSDDRVNVITQDSAFGTTTKGLALFGKYQATPTTYTDNDAAPVLLDVNGRVVLSSDIEIGGVELKDGTSDNRAEIKAPNAQAFNLGLKTIPARYMLTIPTLTDTYSSPLLLGSKGQLLTNIYDGTSTLALGTGTIKTVPCAITDGTTTADVLVQDAAFGTASKGFAVFGKYQATPTTYTDNDAVPILLDVNGRVVLSSDIEIGSVELKDGTTDNRVEIKAPNVGPFNFGLKSMPARYMASPPSITDTFTTPLLTDSTGNLKINSVADIPTAIVGGTQTVTTAGVRVALGASTTIKSVSIRANALNTGIIYVGGVTVSSANGIALAANDQTEFNIANLATVFIDSSVSLEGVGFTYFS